MLDYHRLSGASRLKALAVACLLTIILSPLPSQAFYLPGVAPASYDVGQAVPLHVNRLTPTFSTNDDQIHSMFSYNYYDPLFNFCRPKGGPLPVRESLGSIIFGDRIMTSPFELKMGVNETCKPLCQLSYSTDNAGFVNHKIAKAYNVNWLVDRLPAAQVNVDEATKETFYSPGFALGDVGGNSIPLLHNHFSIVIEYHRVRSLGQQNKFRVVGVVVNPESNADSSIDEKKQAHCPTNGKPLSLSTKAVTTVAWTYDVIWKESDTAWATRWDKYLHVYDPSIHWYSLVYSAIFVLFLVGLVATILVRTLKKDIARYNRLDISLDDLGGTSIEDDIQEDSGWKLIHGDVFRSPRHPLLFSIFLGNGAQLFVMTGVTVVFSLFGLLSPSNRGLLGTTILILYTFLGSVGGYVAARAYKTFGGDSWKKLSIYTPLLVPGIAFAVFFTLNFFVWVKGSSNAVPLVTMLALVAIWFAFSAPLSVLGSWVGLKRPAITSPTRTNQIPRQIPPTVRVLRPIPTAFLTSLIPFAAIFVELYFVMSSIWSSKIYYMFGFLFLCYALMIMTTAASTIILVYFLLCAEDYRWQWRSFIASGMLGGYVFINALFFWATRISFGGITGAVLYLGYSALLAFLVFILAGTIGFLSSFVFVRTIYASIKID